MIMLKNFKSVFSIIIICCCIVTIPTVIEYLPDEMAITIDVYNIPKEKISITRKKDANSEGDGIITIKGAFQDSTGSIEIKEFLKVDCDVYDIKKAKATMPKNPFPSQPALLHVMIPKQRNMPNANK